MKKTYEIPSVELAQLMPSSIVLAGSPGGGSSNPTIPTDPTPGTNINGD